MTGSDILLLSSIDTVFRALDAPFSEPWAKLRRLQRIGLVRQVTSARWEVGNVAFWEACRKVAELFEPTYLQESLRHRQSLAFLTLFPQRTNVDNMHYLAGIPGRTQNRVLKHLKRSQLVEAARYSAYELTERGEALRPLFNPYRQMHADAGAGLRCVHQAGAEAAWVCDRPDPALLGLGHAVQVHRRPQGGFLVARSKRQFKELDWGALELRARAGIHWSLPVPDSVCDNHLAIAGSMFRASDLAPLEEKDRIEIYGLGQVRARLRAIQLWPASGALPATPDTPRHGH